MNTGKKPNGWVLIIGAVCAMCASFAAFSRALASPSLVLIGTGFVFLIALGYIAYKGIWQDGQVDLRAVRNALLLIGGLLCTGDLYLIIWEEQSTLFQMIGTGVLSFLFLVGGAVVAGIDEGDDSDESSFEG